MDHRILVTIPSRQLPFSASPEQDTDNEITYTMAGALVRLTGVIFLVTLSIWANVQASKFFDVKVLNGAKHTAEGKQFQLMFVSNGHAERLILNSSHLVENILFPGKTYAKKPIHRVTVYFSAQKIEDNVLVSTQANNSDEFIITLSPNVMAVPAEAETAVAAAIQLGMAHVWLSDGNGKAPKALVNAMAEVLVMFSGITTTKWEHKDVIFKQNTTCWDDNNSAAVAQFLKYSEEQRPGFVARLNSAMQEEFKEDMVELALGMPASSLCLSYISSTKIEEVVSLSTGNYN